MPRAIPLTIRQALLKASQRGLSPQALAERFHLPTPDLMRRLLVSVLLHGNRIALLRELDGALLGLRAGRERVAQLRAS